MSGTVFAKNSRDLADQAPDIADAMLGLLTDDVRAGLRYSLLRLELAGLTQRDRAELLELGRLALGESDVSEHAKAIAGRDDASPLAVAIAHVVGHARISKGAAMLGAVYGAYAGIREDQHDDRERLAVIGAAVGAAAQDAHALLDKLIAQESWSRYVADRD